MSRLQRWLLLSEVCSLSGRIVLERPGSSREHCRLPLSRLHFLHLPLLLLLLLPGLLCSGSRLLLLSLLHLRSSLRHMWIKACWCSLLRRDSLPVRSANRGCCDISS